MTVAAYLATYLAWTLGDWGGPALAPVRSAIFVSAPPFVVALLAAWDITGRPTRDARPLPPGARRAWALFAVATGINGAASVCWGLWQVGHPNAATPRWVDLCTLLSTPFLLASFVTFPTAGDLRRGRGRALLDCLLALVPSVLAIWYLGLHGDHTASLVDRVIALGFPVGDLVLLFGIATMLLRVPHALVRGPLRWLAVSQVLATAADFAYACRNTSGIYLSSTWIDVVWLLSWAADWVALAVQTDVRTRPDVQTFPAGVDDSLLPAACVTLGYLEVFIVLHPQWPSDLAVVLAAAALSTVLLMLRQIAATRTNVGLLHAKARLELQYRQLFDHSPLPMWVYEWATGAVLDVNAAAIRHYGYARAEFLRLTIRDLRPPEEAARLAEALADTGPGTHGPTIGRHLLADGRVRDVEVTGDAIDFDGRPARLIVAVDVTEREAAHADLARLAFHDGLTGLPNRALFHERAAQALAAASGGSPQIAVLFLDLDDFKTVNDSLGHAAGDDLLRSVADRLRSATRGSDTVARLGGDEFAVLLTHVADQHAVDSAVARLHDALGRLVTVHGREIPSRGSLGVAMAEPGDTVDTLLRNADAAMYAAKQSGKGGTARFRPHMHEAALDRLELEAALRDTLAGGDSAGTFQVHYQPVLCLATGRPIGAEALVRWQHPTRGMISPARFIPLAETTGLIVPLGTWVLREACRSAAQWPYVDGYLPTVAVNLSSRQLGDPSLVETVRATLADVGLAPERLTLELTESALVEHPDLAIRVLGELRALGIRIAVDDFGIGYSSLAYLQRFPLDILKIDKAFVDSLGRGARHDALARAIVALGQTLGLRTIAEGVEREEQHRILAALGCDAAQGFLFARPLTEPALAAAWDHLDVGRPDATPATLRQGIGPAFDDGAESPDHVAAEGERALAVA